MWTFRRWAISFLIAFLTLWIWVYVFTRNNFRYILRLLDRTRWWLDVEEHPVRSLGIVTAALSSLAYFVVLVVTKLAAPALRKEAQWLRSQTSRKCASWLVP